MTSAFGWLDTDESRRDAMLRIVELFKDEGTVDDLGIGSIRDAISDALFPGTSVLHTRPRYLLFVPWLLHEATKARTPEAMKAEFRRLEIRLIYSLQAGGEGDGVIGGRAKESLRRTASAAYWAAGQRYGIRRWETSPDGFFRRTMTRRTLDRSAPTPEDAGAAEPADAGLDPNLPAPPADLMKSTTFALTDHETRYLADRLTMSTAGSTLSWLIEHPQPIDDADFVWRLDLAGLPTPLRELIGQAELFHTVIRGAPLLYNLMLAQKRNDPDLAATYADQLIEWHEDTIDGSLAAWDSRLFWSTLRRTSSEIRPLTRAFVDSWVAEARIGGNMDRRESARKLVADREMFLKGGRARLRNQSALDRWQGASGLTPLAYRWPVARAMLAGLWELA